MPRTLRMDQVDGFTDRLSAGHSAQDMENLLHNRHSC